MPRFAKQNDYACRKSFYNSRFRWSTPKFYFIQTALFRLKKKNKKRIEVFNVLCIRSAERFCGARDKISIWSPWWRHVCYKPLSLGAPVRLLGLQRSETLFPCILSAITIVLTQLPVHYVTVFNLRYVKNVKLKHFREPLSSRGPGASCSPCPPSSRRPCLI